MLLLTPGWVTYDALIRLAGAVPVSVPLRKGAGRMLTGADLAARITPRTRAILLNTPHNPTGRVFGPEELEAIADTARRHDLLVLADETLEYLVYTDAVHRSIAALPAMAERTLTFNGFSKAYSMAGWRVGYVHGPAPLVANMLKVHQHLVTCANVVAQKAATAALGGPGGGRAGIRSGIRAEIRAGLADRRDLVARALDSVPGIRCPAPEAGLFCFPDVAGTGMDDREFAGFCLEEAQVAVLPGSAFGAGGEGHVRVAFGRRSSEALAAGVERIREALSRRDRAGAGSRAAAGAGSEAGAGGRERGRPSGGALILTAAGVHRMVSSARGPARTLVAGADIGGTFTDVCLLDPKTGRSAARKVLTTTATRPTRSSRGSPTPSPKRGWPRTGSRSLRTRRPSPPTPSSSAAAPAPGC